jgi:murein L,D-transpeptidase YcbB/YkuD
MLRDFPQWTNEKIDTVIARNAEQTIFLKKAIPVHVLYYTVWKEKDGSVEFRGDCYGLDRRLGWAFQLASPMVGVLPLAQHQQIAPR